MENNLQELLEMFTYRRPHGGFIVDEFVKEFLLPIDGLLACPKSYNYIIDVGDGAPVTLFSSHVDTVHRKDGMQNIVYNPETGFVSKDDKECLGADDATGVWLMKQMIDEGIAGRYIFHVGEEKGGIGSGDLLKDAPHWLKGIKHAVAFDRRGTQDVITYQAGGRCCSDDFAKELSLQMNKGGLLYKPCDGGVFTDTATYTETVKECTNLSVGYFSEHTASERQDIIHLLNMCDALMTVDWAGLPAVRDETAIDYGDWGAGLYGSGYGYRRRNNKRYNPSRANIIAPAKNTSYDPEAWGDNGEYIPHDKRPSVIASRQRNGGSNQSAIKSVDKYVADDEDDDESTLRLMNEEAMQEMALINDSWNFGDMDTHIMSTVLGEDTEYPSREVLKELCIYDTDVLVELLYKYLSLSNFEIKQEVELLNTQDRERMLNS